MSSEIVVLAKGISWIDACSHRKWSCYFCSIVSREWCPSETISDSWDITNVVQWWGWQIFLHIYFLAYLLVIL